MPGGNEVFFGVNRTFIWPIRVYFSLSKKFLSEAPIYVAETKKKMTLKYTQGHTESTLQIWITISFAYKYKC